MVWAILLGISNSAFNPKNSVLWIKYVTFGNGEFLLGKKLKLLKNYDKIKLYKPEICQWTLYFTILLSNNDTLFYFI